MRNALKPTMNGMTNAHSTRSSSLREANPRRVLESRFIHKESIFLKSPTRITIALDEETVDLFENAKKETGLSQSELIRKALRFYYENRAIIDDTIRKKLYNYMDLLLSGEHVILDLDHWLLFLSLIETSPEKEIFWDNCKKVADSHAEQLKGKIHTVQELLERLETCNFFRISRETEERFTLVLFF